MLLFINLCGKINGSATLDAGEQTASFELHLRCGNKVRDIKRLSVFLVSQTGTAETVLDEKLRGTGRIGKARGIILLDGNTVISSGANGMSERTLKKAQEKLLLTIAGDHRSENNKDSLENSVSSDTTGPAHKPVKTVQSDRIEYETDFCAASEAARRIRETAKQLFSADEKQAGGISKTEIPQEGLPIGNPFPRIFGRDTRFCRVSESELSGTAFFRGHKCEVTAVRIFDRTKTKPPHTRAFRAADTRGDLYWIILKPRIVKK